MEQKLREVLAARQKRRIIDKSLISAAVLVPVYRKDGEYHTLFIKRSETVKAHKGEVSFPGGVYEARDGNLLETALRESEEEIGLKAEDAEILGELDDEASVTTNYLISPFVAAIPWPYRLRLDGREAEEIIEAPIASLLEVGESRTEIRYGRKVTVHYYRYRGRTIWGATARILNKFLAIFTRIGEEPPGEVISG